MQRKVVGILKKYLRKGYDDCQTEIMYESPFSVLMAGGVKRIPTDDWHRADPPPCEDILVRPLARELIATIRGVNQADLYIIPDRERVVRILRDIAPLSGQETIDWAEYHADPLIKELTRIRPQDFWRGERIETCNSE